jgi:hypothetical protein
MTRTCWCTAAVLFLALGVVQGAPAQPASPAPASEATAAGLWATMLESQGAAYAAARGKLLQSAAARRLLAARSTDPDWKVEAIARAALERLSQPELYAQYERDLERALFFAFMARPGPFLGVGAVFSSHSDPSKLGPPLGSLDSPAAVPFLREVLLKGHPAPATFRPPVAGETPESARRREKQRETYSRVAQCYAAMALGSLNDPRGIGPLLDMTATGEFGELRGTAAAALGAMRRPEAEAPLRKLLRDPSPFARAAAAGALGHLLTMPDDPDLVWVAQNDPDVQVRAAAQLACANIAAWLRAQREAGGTGSDRQQRDPGPSPRR